LSTKGAKQQPARGSERAQVGAYESVDFARKRERTKRRRELAKASRRKNRH
jgi:hypothetical protein